jgi:hypothetical protein
MDSGSSLREETSPGEDRAGRRDWLPLALFVASVFVFGALYGMFAARHELFPYPTLRAALTQAAALKSRAFELDPAVALPDRPHYSIAPDAPPPANGLVLVVGVGADLLNFARVVDRRGDVIHEWRPNWFDIWPDDPHVPDAWKPQSVPGVLIHGAAIAPDGDLVFNFDHLSTVRLDACGKVRWKLPNHGHHSVFLTEAGEIWVPAERNVAGEDAEQPHPLLREMTIQKLSAEGEILLEHSLNEILDENGRDGLLHMIRATPAEGDVLHLNDVEVFPSTLTPGFFRPGDILVSLRNINTLVVLDPTGQEIKFDYTGEMLRQHDPDFTSGNSISVFDNHNKGGGRPDGEPRRSRVLDIQAPSGATREVFGGAPAYFTQNMGMHQILPNGNVLVAVSWQGQVLEFAPDGRLAWQFENELPGGTRGLVTEVALLPPEMDAAFFRQLKEGCGPAL